ncbi:MAG: kelch repeat-containing protein [Thermoplasmata archaeon]
MGGSRRADTATPAVEEYDPATDTWTRKADMPTARCLHSTSALNGSIYSIGGSLKCWPWTPTPTVEVYNTGFVPEESTGMNSKGKLVKPWGEIKSD